MSQHQNYGDYQIMVSSVFQYLMFYWLIQITDSDPPWMTKDIKNEIKLKNTSYRQCMRHQTQISSLLKVEDLRNEISNLITKSSKKILSTH